MSENTEVNTSVSQTATPVESISQPDNGNSSPVQNTGSLHSSTDTSNVKMAGDTEIINNSESVNNTNSLNGNEAPWSNLSPDMQNFFTEAANNTDSPAIDEQHNQNANLDKYNTDSHFQNKEFRNLYSAAYDALGANLDTDRFISLLDNYVESKINAYNDSISLKKENQDMTDKLQFQSGKQTKSEKIPRMQDIPPEELEKYIAKYI